MYQYLDSAERMLTDICKKYSRNLLLHGDLHHENILKNENGGYTVIDPKGVIGDPVFDLSRFILDEFRDDLTSEPKDVVIDFVQKLGDGAGIPCEILLRCLYIETVIWLFREELANGESLEECQQLITNMKVAYEFAHNRKEKYMGDNIGEKELREVQGKIIENTRVLNTVKSKKHSIENEITELKVNTFDSVMQQNIKETVNKNILLVTHNDSVISNFFISLIILLKILLKTYPLPSLLGRIVSPIMNVIDLMDLYKNGTYCSRRYQAYV